MLRHSFAWLVWFWTCVKRQFQSTVNTAVNLSVTLAHFSSPCPQLAKLVVARQPLVFFLVYDPLLHWHFLCLPSCGLLPISGDFSIMCTLCICTNRLMETCVTCILFLFIPMFSNFVPCKIWASNSDGKMEGSILKLVKLVLWRFKNIKATWAVAICCKAPTVCPYLKSHSSCSTRMKTCCFKV